MIQIDMQMPAVCDECPLLDESGDYAYCRALQESRGYTFRTREKRFENCPLHDVFIPERCPHCGRSIFGSTVG